MKKINFFLLIFLLFFSFLSKSFSDEKIVFLDIEFAVNNSNIGKKALNNLKEKKKIIKKLIKNRRRAKS